MSLLLSIIGVLGVPISLICLLIAAVRKKPKKKPLIALAVCFVAFCIAVAIAPDSEEPVGSASAPVEEVKADSEPIERETKKEESQKEETAPPEEPSADAVSDNPLIAAELKTAPLTNGFGEEIDGEHAYIEIDKDELKAVTEEQFREFVDSRVADSNYNWVSINCPDGTGITFPGSISTMAEYGEQDSNGSITKLIGDISINKKKVRYDKYVSYSSGMYKVGSDIKAKEYIVISDIDATASYIEVSNDSTGTIESIVTNDSFNGSRYITVSDGQYLTLQGCTAYPASYIANGKVVNEIFSDDCMYKVGTELEAGEYRVTAVNGSGYYEVDSDSTGGIHTIVTNELFDSTVYITVSDGQYLKLQGAILEIK